MALAPKIEVFSTEKLCRNAGNPDAFYCFHYGNKMTADKEATDWKGECEACAIVFPNTENLPSWQRNEDED
jgi:hypothetical protein